MALNMLNNANVNPKNALLNDSFIHLSICLFIPLLVRDKHSCMHTFKRAELTTIREVPLALLVMATRAVSDNVLI